MSNKTLLAFVFTLLLLNSHLFAQDTIQYKVPGRTNAEAQQQKPYVILISADGFRYDFAEKHNAEFIKKISTKGVRAVSMRPSYPSLTFPNHYSIATGLYPAHHGIVANTFYDKKKDQFYTIRNKKAVQDSSWYGGVPLWVLAERQKMLSASFYWVGSESHVDGVDPSYYFNYNEAIPIDQRLEILKQWLTLPAEERPHFITFYFPEVDHAAHRYGTNSFQTRDAVQFIDNSMQKMNEMCAELGLPINFIFISDHGMTNVDTTHPIPQPAVIDTSKFIIANGGALTQLYAKNKKDIKPTYRKLKKEAKDYDVYLAKRTPKRWHYSKKNDSFNRIGDIILVARPPKVFGFSNRSVSMGQHGFDNYLPEMQATFYAWGPAFKQNHEIGNFENIHIYPLIAHILGLDINNKIDGKLKVLKGILK